MQGLFGIGEQRFKFDGFVDMGAMGLDAADGMVAAVGDLDGGQLYVASQAFQRKLRRNQLMLNDAILASLELFVLSSDQKSVTFFAWNRGLSKIRSNGSGRAECTLYIS